MRRQIRKEMAKKTGGVGRRESQGGQTEIEQTLQAKKIHPKLQKGLKALVASVPTGWIARLL